MRFLLANDAIGEVLPVDAGFFSLTPKSRTKRLQPSRFGASLMDKAIDPVDGTCQSYLVASVCVRIGSRSRAF